MRFLPNVISLMIIFTAFSTRPVYSQCFIAEKVYIADEKKDLRVNKIEEAIKTHNILNIIDLSEEQLTFVISKAKEIDKIARELYRGYSRYSEEMLPFEIKIEQQVGTGRIALDETALEGYIKNKKQCNQFYYKLNDAVEEGIKAVEGRLKEFQLVILDNYTPCIIPILNNNLIGASNKSIGIGYVLMGARWMPEAKYKAEKDAFIAKNIALLKTAFCPCNRLCEESIVKKELENAIDEVRKLDAADFSVKINMLAQELEEKIMLKDPVTSREQKIKRFLLSSQSIPILEKRLRSKK